MIKKFYTDLICFLKNVAAAEKNSRRREEAKAKERNDNSSCAEITGRTDRLER